MTIKQKIFKLNYDSEVKEIKKLSLDELVERYNQHQTMLFVAKARALAIAERIRQIKKGRNNE